MNRIFVTGDVHQSVMPRLSNTNFPTAKDLDRSDLVFIAGDFGVLWNATETRDESYILDWLSTRNHTTMVIGGNHENWPRLHALPIVEKFGVKLGLIRENVYFVPNGTLINYGGKKIFCFGGAMSTDKNQRVEGVSWWPQEIPSYEEMNFGTLNLESVDYEVDVIITHTMPCENVRMFCMSNGYHQDRIDDPTAHYLSFIAKHTKFKQWFCGHFHVNQEFGDVMVLYEAIVDIDLMPPSDCAFRNFGHEKISPLW